MLDEPLFIIQIASQLIEGHAELDDHTMERLDSLTTARFGKPVIPFVFEEMINVWGLDLKQHQDTWEELGKRVSRDQVIVKRLNNLAKLEPLPVEEAKVLTDLEKLLPTDEARLDKLASDVLAKRNYVYAAEGFLQLLENDEQRLIDQDREYLIDDGFEVGELLIRCAQNGEKWENLKREEQSLIISFANIFEATAASVPNNSPRLRWQREWHSSGVPIAIVGEPVGVGILHGDHRWHAGFADHRRGVRPRSGLGAQLARRHAQGRAGHRARGTR